MLKAAHTLAGSPLTNGLSASLAVLVRILAGVTVLPARVVRSGVANAFRHVSIGRAVFRRTSVFGLRAPAAPACLAKTVVGSFLGTIAPPAIAALAVDKLPVACAAVVARALVGTAVFQA